MSVPAPDRDLPRLPALLAGLGARPTPPDVPVAGLTEDSRAVGPGWVFLARRGRRRDGTAFLGEAARRGAVAVVVAAGAAVSRTGAALPVIEVDDLAAAAGALADRFHGEPSAHLDVVGVTGTNGKTTLCHLLAAAGEGAAAPGPRWGLVGTLGHGPFGALRPGGLTTPGVIEVHRALAECRALGVGRVAMEVSSHALDQERVAGVRFRAAVFTNLTHDHLDYHGDLAAYGAAKRRLFERPELALAAVNGDDPASGTMLEALPPGCERIVYGLGDGVAAARGRHLRGRIERLDARGLRLAVEGTEGRAVLASPLLGRFNALNLLGAAAVRVGLGEPLALVCERLAGLGPPPGRLERHGGAGAPLAVVDYAHTPDALACALAALREITAGRLVCVFGCGGERDRAKRPRMAAVAGAMADEVIVTDDNPRGEDPRRIVAEIVAGLPAGCPHRVERDRARAIVLALAGSAPGDVVLIAGKGHEDYQETAGTRTPFSDARVVERWLGRRRR